MDSPPSWTHKSDSLPNFGVNTCATPGTAVPPPCSPSPRAPRVPAAPPNQWPRHRTWPAPVHVVAAPTAHAATWTEFPHLGAQVSLSTALSSLIKGVELAAARIAQTPSRHCRRQWCPRRAPPSRVPSSSPFRLLLRPSHQLAGVFPPTAAAGTISATGEHSNQAHATPRPLSPTFPASPAAGLAGIRQAAPPLAPLDCIAKP
jgi:hypothetical protein